AWFPLNRRRVSTVFPLWRHLYRFVYTGVAQVSFYFTPAPCKDPIQIRPARADMFGIMRSMDTDTHILVVDDDRDIRTPLAEYLDS
ncbi:hypothetical protein, partial [Acinetobacter sp. LH3_13]|uniref:hypothetical protein n=1 Tax=Acinetobacter sp. LH3_13 TaxID=3434463 RepID=UPI003EB8EAC0